MAFSQEESQQIAIIYLSSVVVGLLVVLSRDRPRNFQIASVFIMSSAITGLLMLWIVPRDESLRRCAAPDAEGSPVQIPPNLVVPPPPSADAAPTPAPAPPTPPTQESPLPPAAAPPPAPQRADSPPPPPATPSDYSASHNVSLDDIRSFGFCPVWDLSINPGVDALPEKRVSTWQLAANYSKSLSAPAFTWLATTGVVYPKQAPLRVKTTTKPGIALSGYEGSLVSAGKGGVYCVMADIDIGAEQHDMPLNDAYSIKEAAKIARRHGADAFVYVVQTHKVYLKNRPFSFSTPTQGSQHAGIRVYPPAR